VKKKHINLFSCENEGGCFDLLSLILVLQLSNRAEGQNGGKGIAKGKEKSKLRLCVFARQYFVKGQKGRRAEWAER